ncbi:MAG: hypothetical protein H0V66_02370 [Bdellovibrionales bacterium]|nr:hypothetical protein [Bdellovibrionales bacterium]
MFNSKSLIIMSFLLVSSVQAKIETIEDHVLASVDQKLTHIQALLKDQRLFVTSATFNWPELGQFREEMLYVVAHDPTGPVPKDTPVELLPSYLTQKLKDNFSKLEASVYKIGALSHSEEWLVFKTDMEQFFKYREEFLYGPARVMFKAGLVTHQLEKLKQAASVLMKTHETKNISVRVIDPAIEGLTSELNELNFSVRQLKELNQPKPVEIKTIFQEKNLQELGLLTLAAFFIGALGTLFLKWVFKKSAQSRSVKQESVPINSFDYTDWLKRLGASLKALKANEDKLIEENINLKNFCTDLRQARKSLNMADNHQDYYLSLEQLNSIAPQLEDYFDKLNLKKTGEHSRQMVKLVVQLCDAIEAKQEISLAEFKPKPKKPDLEIVENNAA